MKIFSLVKKCRRFFWSVKSLWWMIWLDTEESVNLPMKGHNNDAQLSRGTKRRRNKEQIMTKQTCRHKHRGATFERSVGKLLGGGGGGDLNQFCSRETSPLILTQLKITNVCSFRTEAVYLICETSQWNTYNHNHCNETKFRAQCRSEAR